jgi:hypothetical protein
VGNVVAEGTYEVNVVHECPPPAKRHFHTNDLFREIQKTLYVG